MNPVPLRLFTRFILGAAIAPALALAAGPQPDRVILDKTVAVTVLDAQTSVKDEKETVQALTVEGAQALTTRLLAFQQGSQSLEIVEAYTAKREGGRRPLADSMIEKQAGMLGGNLASSFPNMQLWRLRFPDVQVGDRVVLHYRLKTSQPPLPGWHSVDWLSGDPFETRRVRFQLKSPLQLPWHVHAPGMVVEHRQDAGEDSWEITGQLPAVWPDPQGVNRLARAQGVAASTFSSPQAIGDAFAQAVSQESRVTEQVKALAEKIAAGHSGREETIRAFHDWVRSSLRYVSSYLDPRAAWSPRGVDAILTSGQGDCKDIAVVLIALLKARGIEAEPVLVALGNEYELLPVGIPQFTHAVVYVPTEALYLDTTSVDLPMGQLPLALRHKPVVRARVGGSQIERIPAPSPEDLAVTSTGRYRMAADGRMSSDIRVGFSGYAAWQVHQQLTRIPPGSSGGLALARMLAQARLTGRGTLVSNFQASRALEEVHVKAEIENFLPTTQVRSLPATPWVPFLAYPLRERLAVASAGPRQSEGVCPPASVHERFSLELEPGLRVTSLPGDEQFEASGLRYVARYREDGQAVSVEREYRYEPASLVCSADARKDRDAAWARIMRDLNGAIIIQQDPSGASSAPRVGDGRHFARGTRPSR